MLILVVFILTLVQLWVLYSTNSFPGYGEILANDQGLPAPDQRGAFLVLKEGHGGGFQGNLIALLATTDAGVIDADSGAHLHSNDLSHILVQSAAFGDGSEYRVYRLGEQDNQSMDNLIQPGGKTMYIQPKNGVWLPGNYVVDTPSEGMFGGRTYFEFYIDPPTR